MKQQDDWADDPDFREFADRVKKDALPKIKQSAFFIAFGATKEDADIKMAVELGLCILMDKPLIVLAPKGRVVTPRLLRIADHVIEFDPNGPSSGMEEVSAKLQAIMNQ